MAYEHSFANSYLDALQRLVDFVSNGNPAWAATTAYSVGTRINPANGYRYECTVAGTSGSTAPTWPTTVNSTVADGSVTWKCIATTLPAAQAWTILQQTFTTSADGLVYFKAPGLAGNSNIYMGVQTASSSVIPSYSWELNGFYSYSSTNAFNNQFNGLWATGQANPFYISLLGSTQMEYYFIGNGQRAAGFFICGQVVQSFYMGFINPYAPPAAWPYPLYIGGHATSLVANSATGANFLYNGGIYFTDNTWKFQQQFIGYNNTFTSCNSTYNNTLISYEKNAYNAGVMIPNASGFMLFPLTIGYQDSSSTKVMPIGEFDGVFDIIKTTQITGDIVTAGTTQYVCFNDNSWTSPTDYFALALV